MSLPRFSAFFLGLLGVLTVSGTALADRPWHQLDIEEFDRIKAAVPAAATLFDEAEASLRAGDLNAADQQLLQARGMYPNSFLLGRRHCQVLTELGRQADAEEACSAAQGQNTAMDSRAIVGATVAGTEPPRPRELVQAVRRATAARGLQRQPFSEAAFCDIAHHIGDEAMLNSCVQGLEAIAPHHFETARWRSVQRHTPAWALWLGWGLLGAAVAFTVGHGLRRSLRKPARSRAASIVAAAVFGLVASIGASAQAQQPVEEQMEFEHHWQLSRFPIDWANPESKIPTVEERNKDPLQFGYFLQDLNVEALKAERKGDWRNAVKLWRAAAKAVPDMAVGFSKACRAHQMLDETEQALEYCGKAVNLEGATLEDFLRYAELVANKPTALSAVDIQDMDALVTHLREKEQIAPAAVVECRLGIKLEDQARLERCTKVLAQHSPQDPRTLTFQWSYALMRKDYGQAKQLLAAMAKTDMNPQALAQARETTATQSALWRRPFTDWRYGLGLTSLVLLVGGLLVARFWRRRDTRVAPGPGTAPAT